MNFKRVLKLNLVVTLCAKARLLTLGLLLLWGTPSAWAQRVLVLSAPLNVYESSEAERANLTLPTGAEIHFVRRHSAGWVEISWAEQTLTPALVRNSDLKKMLTAPQTSPTSGSLPKKAVTPRRPAASRWGVGLGFKAGYQYQLHQTLSTPPLDGKITGFQGAGSGPLLFVDIPWARWTQWRFEYQQHRHDMTAESLKHTNPTVSFRRQKSFSSYHLQLRLYSLKSKKIWQAPGVIYSVPESATVQTDQGGVVHSTSLGKGELRPSWGLSYSLGRDWALGEQFLVSGQLRAQVHFTGPAHFGVHGVVTAGFLF